MKTPKSPEELCWLYAAGCLEDRHNAGTLEDDAYAVLKMCMNSNKFPPEKLIRDSFPKPFAYLEKHWGEISMRNMRIYWRLEHLEFDQQTPVYLARIRNLVPVPDKPRMVEVYTSAQMKHPSGRPGGRQTYVENIHQYDLSKVQHVYIHGQVLAEILP